MLGKYTYVRPNIEGSNRVRYKGIYIEEIVNYIMTKTMFDKTYFFDVRSLTLMTETEYFG